MRRSPDPPAGPGPARIRRLVPCARLRRPGYANIAATRAREGLHPRAKRDAAGQQLLPWPAAFRRRPLLAHRRRPRTPRGSSWPCSALAVLFTYLIGTPALGAAGGADRRGRGGDLSSAARVPGHADERAAGGDAALRRRSGDALGGRTEPRRGRVLAPGLSLGAWLLVRPEYSGDLLAASGRGLRTEVGDGGRVSLRRWSCLWVAVVVVPGRFAMRLRSIGRADLDRGGQVLFAGLRHALGRRTRKGSARRSWSGTPNCVRSCPGSAAGADPGGAGGPAVSRHGSDAALAGWAGNGSGRRSDSRWYAGSLVDKLWLIWGHGPRA